VKKVIHLSEVKGLIGDDLVIYGGKIYLVKEDLKKFPEWLTLRELPREEVRND